MQTRFALFHCLLLSLLDTPAFAQTGFDNDRATSLLFFPPGILTEGFPGPPVVAIPAGFMGLGPLDEIDALSFGDDHAVTTVHTIVFSPNFITVGIGAGTTFEFATDTLPGFPPAAAADIFLQDAPPLLNILAPPGLGYDAGTLTGDEANATWMSPCIPGGPCDDLDAFDYTDPLTATGVYFSLKFGSPALAALGATPGDILYSDLSGTPPVIATLAGAGPATAASLGILGFDLDALNVVGTVGPVTAGGGVITAGPVGPSIAGTVAPSTHLLEFSVGPFTGIDADVLVRTGPGAFAVHTPAPAIGLSPHEDLNALEATPCGPSPASYFTYNGSGINLDLLSSSPVIIGSPWTATLAPQAARGAGVWTILLRSASAAGPILDLGTFFALPPAGLSELLVGIGFIANFAGPAHGGGGTTASFSAPVPLSCGLVASPWFAQAVVLGDLPAGAGVLDPWFSSAVGGTIGTF